ncbi:lysophospholipid acyltransferase LPEAT2 isoform X1 [Nicotiana tabacum]|uniref:Lysophospholipid acyltransferase LPEAT2 isoform X1 n=1 Tax=Nicotiana tabacum TaxID=4097 RepID=A0A1S4D2K9_TOBAC|nr:PREDICTED: lysophospholipid acyltransferase LPEAT2-like isoform X1 [Nicotiana tabacum]
MSDHTVSAPLLPFSTHLSDSDHDQAPEPHVIVTVDDDDGVHQLPNGDDHQLVTHISEVDDNPYAFLGAKRFDMPGSTTVDPFRNNTPRIEGVYEWFKIVVCLPLALVRLLLFGLSLMVGYVATRVALYGWKDKHNPMPKWRSRLMCVTRSSARTILFSFGYQWIRRKGKPAPREIAPVVVSNHVSYIDPIFFFYELFPTIVASESHDSMPFVGTIIRAMQVIYVNRFSPTSRKHAVSEIKRKASCNQFPRVLLFPEGTTTNGRAIISFQLGAFIPGYPIQPVIVRYPHVHFDQSWGNVSLGMLMFRMFTQFHNFMEVEYLPVVSPHENQKENAVRFAQRTGHAVATALNVVQTSHSYGDVLLLAKALEANQENPSLYFVEMAAVEAAFHLSSLEAVEFLDVFLSMNPDSKGQVEIQDFLRVLRLKPCTLSEKMFGFTDMQKSGKMTFKQFLVGSAHILKQPLFHQACESAFTACGDDGKNYILEQEFGYSLMLSLPGLSNNEIHGLFTLFDTDHDGKISKADLIACLRRYPLLIALFSPCLLQQTCP